MGVYLELEDLTPEQYDFFIRNMWNGVGSREFPLDPPDFIFANPSKLHDFLYWRGGNEVDRLNADQVFLADELIECRKQAWFRKLIYTSIAYLYYLILRVLGKYAFEYYAEPAKTWDEFMEHWITYNASKTKSKVIAKHLVARIRNR